MEETKEAKITTNKELRAKLIALRMHLNSITDNRKRADIREEIKQIAKEMRKDAFQQLEGEKYR